MTKKTTIRVRIDELEYTRSGLRTRQAMPLTVGALNRVELVRPDRVRTIKGGMVGFAKGSAFPTPGALMAFWRARAKGSAFAHHGASDGRWSSEVFQVYGHADRDGDETSNKALAERRARAGHALIVHDVDVFVAVSEEDSWDTAQFQSMLRTLACDGGPVDGKEERLTRQGVATFVERYNRGVYHHATNTGPTEQLEEDDTLNAANKKAIMEAFVLVHGIGLDASVSHPTHPWHGCGQYNARSFEATAPNRRLSIVPHDAVVELSENAPCTQGDAQACAVVDDELQRCMWYREHVIDPSPPSPALFDPRWLWLGEDLYVLSALTTNEDDAPVTFEVLDGSERVSETMAGVVRGGVAAVVWKSPLAREDGRGRPQISAPRFRATHPQTPAEVVGPWPELEEVEVLKVVESVDVVRARAGGVRLVARDGSYDHLEPFANLREASPHHIALRFVDVPLDAPLDVVLETGDFRQTMVESVTARALEGACGSGEQCHELPPRTGPPTHSLDDLELDDDATVDEARDDDPLEIEFPSGAAAWLDDEPDHGAVQHGSASP